MAELLEEWGVERALVHGGFSSVLALEPPPADEGWPLTLSDSARGPACSRRCRRARPRWARRVSARRITSSIPGRASRCAERLAPWVAVPRAAGRRERRAAPRGRRDRPTR